MPTAYTGVDYSGLLKITGDWLGWGRSGWEDEDEERLDEIIQSGYSFYCNARSIDGAMKGHDWSWLAPVETLTTVADQYAYDLPVTFGASMGPMTWAATDGSRVVQIPVVGEGQVR